MNKVRIFRGDSSEALEKKINEFFYYWGNDIVVENVTQTSDNHIVLISIFYKTSEARV